MQDMPSWRSALGGGTSDTATGAVAHLESAGSLGYDEISYPIMKKSGGAWVAVSHDVIFYHLAASRSRAMFEEHVMVPGRPVTVDGYTVYDTPDIMQRCWARILREAKAQTWATERVGVGQTDCRDARILLERVAAPVPHHKSGFARGPGSLRHVRVVGAGNVFRWFSGDQSR